MLLVCQHLWLCYFVVLLQHLHIIVTLPPRVTENSPSEVAYRMGERVTLPCIAVADPKPVWDIHQFPPIFLSLSLYRLLLSFSFLSSLISRLSLSLSRYLSLSLSLSLSFSISLCLSLSLYLSLSIYLPLPLIRSLSLPLPLMRSLSLSLSLSLSIYLHTLCLSSHTFYNINQSSNQPLPQKLIFNSRINIVFLPFNNK